MLEPDNFINFRYVFFHYFLDVVTILKIIDDLTLKILSMIIAEKLMRIKVTLVLFWK